MTGDATPQSDNRVVRARRSWPRRVAVGALGVAVALAAVRCTPEFDTPSARDATIEPRLIRVPESLRPSDVVPARPGELAGCNVLLVTFDTTRADRIGCYGNDAIDTPVLDRLAADGVLFSEAIAVAPITLPSHASIVTGLYPFHHGARTNGSSRLVDERVTMAEILAGEGYATAAMVSAIALGSQFGIDQGFDVFDDEMEADKSKLLLMAQRSEVDKPNGFAGEWSGAGDDPAGGS